MGKQRDEWSLRIKPKARTTHRMMMATAVETTPATFAVAQQSGLWIAEVGRPNSSWMLG